MFIWHESYYVGAQSIQLGDNEVVICGGMENMSNVPHYLQSGAKVKSGRYEFSRWNGKGWPNRCVQ